MLSVARDGKHEQTGNAQAKVDGNALIKGHRCEIWARVEILFLEILPGVLSPTSRRPEGEESQTWYRAQPPAMDPQLGLQTMENSAGNLRKTLENSCTPQNSYEKAAGIIPILLQDKPLWKIKSERALSLPSFGSPLLSKWKKTPTLMPLSCQMDTFNRKTMEKEWFSFLVLPLSIVTSQALWRLVTLIRPLRPWVAEITSQ